MSARERAKAQKSGFTSKSIRLPDGIQLFGVKKEGIKRIDILPFITKNNQYVEPGLEHYETTYYAHRNVGANNDMYVCPAKMADKRCPICEYRAKMAKDPDANQDDLKEMAPKQRQLFALYDLDDMEAGIQIWDVSFHLFGKQLNDAINAADEDEEVDYFYTLDDGLTLRVGFGSKSFGGNNFYETTNVAFKPRKTTYDPDLIEQVPCLDDLIIIPTYEELKKVFLEMDEHDQGDDDEDEKPRAKKAKRAPVDDDDTDDMGDDDDMEDTDDDDECAACEGEGTNSRGKPCVACKGTGKKRAGEDDEEEEEEPPPKKVNKPAPATKKAAAKKKEEEDDWGDDDWEGEEEEEETPKAKRGRPPKSKPAAGDDEEEEEAPPPKKTAKSAAKAKKPVPDDEDDGEEDWDNWDD